MSRLCRRASALAVAVSSCVLVAACSQTVAGHPGTRSARPSGTGPTGPAATTPAASSTPAATTSAATTTPAVDESRAAFADPTAVRQIVADTTHDLVTTNSYDYRRLPAFLTAGTAVATGAFLTQFRTTVTQVLEPEAARIHAVQTSKVNAIGLSAGPSAGEATLVAVLQQRSTSTADASGRTVLGAAAVTVAQVAGHWLISSLTSFRPGGTPAAGCDPAGTTGLTLACRSAESTTAALTTFTRAGFATQFAHVLTLTTGAVHADLQRTRSTIQQALTSTPGIAATTVAAGVVSASGDAAVVLEIENATRQGDATPTQQLLETHVALTGGRWLVSDVVAVGIN